MEFAILLPVLLTLALLCVDFGRFAHCYIAVTNAARAGAGYGSVNPYTAATKPVWDARVRQAVVDELDENSWFQLDELVMPTPEAINEGNGFWRVPVDVTYPFETLINWPFLPGYNEPVMLRRVVVMRGTR